MDMAESVIIAPLRHCRSHLADEDTRDSNQSSRRRGSTAYLSDYYHKRRLAAYI
jgi:hypothetical protein